MFQFHTVNGDYYYMGFLNFQLSHVGAGNRLSSAGSGNKVGPLSEPQAPAMSHSAQRVRTKWAMLAAVSRLMSGHARGKISVPWMVPITWRQRAGTPARTSSR